MTAQVAVGEALPQKPERQQVVERLEPELPVVADALGAEQASIGREADPFQIIKVAQSSADAEVAGVVDHRLGA